MAKKKASAETSAPTKCKCATCAFSTLVQYFNNPVLAECAMKDPQDRMVANAVNKCPLYVQTQVSKTIKHLSREIL